MSKYIIAHRASGVIIGYPYDRDYKFKTWKDLLAAFCRNYGSGQFAPYFIGLGSDILVNGEVLCSSGSLSGILYDLKDQKLYPSYKKILELLPDYDLDLSGEEYPSPDFAP